MFLKEFGTRIEALGPRGYLQSMAHRAGESVLDPEFAEMTEDEVLEEFRSLKPKE